MPVEENQDSRKPQAPQRGKYFKEGGDIHLHSILHREPKGKCWGLGARNPLVSESR